MVSKKANEAHKLRQQNQEYYDSHNVEPTEVDGQIFRSNLEAQWYQELKNCESFECFECVRLPIWIEGPFGRFLADYKPDLSIRLIKSCESCKGTGKRNRGNCRTCKGSGKVPGERILVELKPNHDLAMADDRQKRALELNPKVKFVVIGGYPYTQRGVTVRLLTGKKESVTRYVKVPEVLRFFDCECED